MTYDYFGERVFHWHQKALDEPHQKVFRKVMDIIGDVEDKTCLDIACGTGVLLEKLAKRGAIAVGIDRSLPCLDYAKGYLTSKNIPAKIVALLHDDIRREKGSVLLVPGSMHNLDRSVQRNSFDLATYTFPQFGGDESDYATQCKLNEVMLETMPHIMKGMGLSDRRLKMAEYVFVHRKHLDLEFRQKDGFQVGVRAVGLLDKPLEPGKLDQSPIGQKYLDFILGFFVGEHAQLVQQRALTYAHHRLIYREAFSVLRNDGIFALATYGAHGTPVESLEMTDDIRTKLFGEEERPFPYTTKEAIFFPCDVNNLDDQLGYVDAMPTPEDYTKGMYISIVRVRKS